MKLSKILSFIIPILVSIVCLLTIRQNTVQNIFKYSTQKSHIINTDTSPSPNTEPGVIVDVESGYKFTGAVIGVNTSSELDTFTKSKKHTVTVDIETNKGIHETGILTIYSSDKLSWKDIYTQIEGKKGTSFNPKRIDLIDQYFRIEDKCDYFSDNHPPYICKFTNQYGVEYVRFPKNYHQGQFPTAIYYIYKLPGNKTIIGYYYFSGRHSDEDDFPITQKVAESIRPY